MKQLKMAKKYLLIIFLFSIFLQSVSALTAESESYSVSSFGTGLQASNPSSETYQSSAISTTEASTRNAENDQFTTNIGFWSNTTYYVSVSIISYSISPRSAVVGSTIGLSISALNSQSVWAKITSPNSQEQTLTLINGQTVNYLPNPSVVGRYNVIFYANSSSGAIAGVADYFDLTEQTQSSSSSSGGGGSGSTIIKSCTYNWDCTSWSLCSDGKQTRECKNTGNCVGTENKPKEETQCSEALFDVVMKFKNIELTSNDTLKFNVSLTETKGIEKIDVQIKYSIIDNKNNEIFSQIETKAIKGDLNYEKEISEIKLRNGEYILRVDIIYGNLQKAFAEQKFEVKDKEILLSPEIKEPESYFKKITKYMNTFIGAIIILIYSLFIFRKRSFSVKFNNETKSRRKYLVYSLTVLLIIVFLIINPERNITSEVINNITSSNKGNILVSSIIFILVLLILLRKKLVSICKKIVRLLSEIKISSNKYPKNSVRSLVNKKVYSENGSYIGKIKDVILEDNKIKSLKIKLRKKHKLKTKRVIINYKHVKKIGEIIIIDEAVSAHLQNQQVFANN